MQKEICLCDKCGAEISNARPIRISVEYPTEKQQGMKFNYETRQPEPYYVKVYTAKNRLNFCDKCLPDVLKALNVELKEEQSEE